MKKLIDQMNVSVDPDEYQHKLKEAELFVDKLFEQTNNGSTAGPSPNVGSGEFCISCMGISMD